MYIPLSPKVIKGIAEDELVRRWSFWFPLLFISIVVVVVPVRIFSGMDTVKVLASAVELVFPSMQDWVSRSSFPETTRLIFSFFGYSAFYYAVLIIRCEKYKKAFIVSPVKRHLKPFMVALSILSAWLFFNTALPVEEQCPRLCIHESRTMQVLYFLFISHWLGYCMAMLYWWVTNFSIIHLGETEVDE